MRAPRERMQFRCALDLDAHHAIPDDHEIEIRTAVRVAQVPALSGRLAPFHARRNPRAAAPASPSCRRGPDRAAQPEAPAPAAVRDRGAPHSAAMASSAAASRARRARSCLTTIAGPRDAAGRGCTDSGPGRAGHRARNLRTRRGRCSCASSRPRSSARVWGARRGMSANTCLRVAARVVALLRHGFAVDRGQHRRVFVERAPEAHLVTLDLDVAHVADLLDGREWLAGNAVPGWRRPVHERRAETRHSVFRARGKRRERGEGGCMAVIVPATCAERYTFSANFLSSAASGRPAAAGVPAATPEAIATDFLVLESVGTWSTSQRNTAPKCVLPSSTSTRPSHSRLARRAARFLGQFATARLARRLARIDGTAGQLPHLAIAIEYQHHAIGLARSSPRTVGDTLTARSGISWSATKRASGTAGLPGLEAVGEIEGHGASLAVRNATGTRAAASTSA